MASEGRSAMPTAIFCGGPGAQTMDNSATNNAQTEGWAAPILLLTWVAGTVDAISYLGLGHVFTANMTGNAVLLGLALGQRQGLAAARSLVALAGFVLGAAMGALLMRRATVVNVRRALIVPVVTEAAVLIIFLVTLHASAPPLAQPDLYGLIVLSAIAMGIQSAAVQRLKLPGIATTVLTSTITSMVAGIVRWMHKTHFSPDAIGTVENETAKNRHLGLQAGVFLIYVAAATASGLFQRRMSLVVGLSPLVAIAGVLVAAISSARNPKIASQ
jgi:uncharacterized membrane protein YoaK (UPF0700 family)